MIWIDIATPKYALFFSYLFNEFKKIDDNILVTTRKSEGYTEAQALLELNHIDHRIVGNYGGETIKDKFVARIKRQQDFVTLFEQIGTPDLFICGSSAEGIQTAFGLGIPTVHFADGPIKADKFSYDDISILAKLTIPLSSLIIKPFFVPDECYTTLGVKPENIIDHDFFEVSLWTKDMATDPQKDFRKRYGLDISRPTILIREEEFKAHYVHERLDVIYDSITILSEAIDANIVLMPRYESQALKSRFSSVALVLEEKLLPEEFYPFIDLLIGGGGTMNVEAATLGIPVISTRSLKFFQDTYLIDNQFMSWAKNPQEVLALTQKLLGTRNIGLNSQLPTSDLVATLVDPIKKFYQLLKVHPS